MTGQGAKLSKKLILDDVCGVQKNSFKNKRVFQNHYRTHGQEIFQCSECPAIWSEGPENISNTKKQLLTHICLNTITIVKIAKSVTSLFLMLVISRSMKTHMKPYWNVYTV